jgi:SAM-dependent methyltransferase
MRVIGKAVSYRDNQQMLSLDRQNALRERYRAQHPDWQPATERFAGLVRRVLSSNSRLLDLGCGRGGLVEQLDHPLTLTLGIDFDFNSLHQHRLTGLPRILALGRRLPLATGSMDVVLASWVLEHLQYPEFDLTEIARILRPGGSFLFITPNAAHPLIRLNHVVGRVSTLQAWLVERFFQRQRADTFPAYYRANRRRRLSVLGRRHNLSLVSLEHIADPTYWGMLPWIYPIAHYFDQLFPPIHLVGQYVRVAADHARQPMLSRGEPPAKRSTKAGNRLT